MERLAIIRGGYVINVVNAEPGFEYPRPHDSVVVDERGDVGVGDWYASDENVFYRPLSTPPDLLMELR